MSPAEKRAAADLQRKRFLLAALQIRGELHCRLLRGRFSTGLYWVDLKRTNAIGQETHSAEAAGTTLIEALERLARASESWGSYERKSA